MGLAKYDLNGDKKINQADVELLKSVYGKVDPNNPLSVKADFDGSGVVNISDFGNLVKNFGDVTEEPKINTNIIPWAIAGLIVIFLVAKK